jgi:hypothetical protein
LLNLHRDQAVVGRHGGSGPLVITGPDALATADLAGLATRIGGRPIGITTTPLPPPLRTAMDSGLRSSSNSSWSSAKATLPGSLAPSAPFWATAAQRGGLPNRKAGLSIETQPRPRS